MTPTLDATVKVRDIPDDVALAAVRDWKKIAPSAGIAMPADFEYGTVTALVRITGAPPKVALRKIEKLVDRGLIEYGASINSAWLTAEGKAAIKTDA